MKTEDKLIIAMVSTLIISLLGVVTSYHIGVNVGKHFKDAEYQYIDTKIIQYPDRELYCFRSFDLKINNEGIDNVNQLCIWATDATIRLE